MDTRPEQPPEGKLIAAAAQRLDLSIREAARRAGLSYGRWRQIVMGYQNISPGVYGAVHAPAKTVAKMAAVVGVEPAQLTAAGREDAARVLEEILRRERPTPLHAPAPGAPAAPPAPPGFVTDEIKEQAQSYADEIWEQLWMLAGNRAPDPSGDGQPPDPGGAALFGPGTHDQLVWDSAAGHSPLGKTWLIAVLRWGQAEQGRAQGTGLARTP